MIIKSLNEDIVANTIPSHIDVPSNGVVPNDGVTLDFPSNVVIPDESPQVFSPPDQHMVSSSLTEGQSDSSPEFSDVMEATVGDDDVHLLVDPTQLGKVPLASDDRELYRPPFRTANSSSPFKMLLCNGVAAAANDSTEAVRQCDWTYYTISLDDTSEYRFIMDEHGKDYVQCVSFSNKRKTISGVMGPCSLESTLATASVGILLEVRLFGIHNMYSLDLDGISVDGVHVCTFYFTQPEIDFLMKSNLNNVRRLLQKLWIDKKKS